MALIGRNSSGKTTLLHTLADASYLVVTATHDLELAAHTDSMLLLAPQGIHAHEPTRQILGQDEIWQQLGLWLPEWVQAVQ